jgi:hypothetical protein
MSIETVSHLISNSDLPKVSEQNTAKKILLRTRTDFWSKTEIVCALMAAEPIDGINAEITVSNDGPSILTIISNGQSGHEYFDNFNKLLKES